MSHVNAGSQQTPLHSGLPSGQGGAQTPPLHSSPAGQQNVKPPFPSSPHPGPASEGQQIVPVHFSPAAQHKETPPLPSSPHAGPALVGQQRPVSPLPGRERALTHCSPTGQHPPPHLGAPCSQQNSLEPKV